MSKNYYDILGVSKSANEAEIKKAYKKMAMKYHPDRNQGDKKSEEEFKKVNEAYDTLKDAQKKAAYDQYGHDAYKESASRGGGAGAGGFGGGFNGFGGGPGGFSDIFEDIFSDFMGGGRGGRAGGAGINLRGEDLQVKINISFKEAFDGISKDIKLNKQKSCSKCKGTGDSKNKEPKVCPTCGGAGKVRVQQGFFAVAQTCPDCRGAGVKVENPCSDCGGLGAVNGVENIEIKIPAGVENGSTLRVKGKGNAGFHGHQAGDLYVLVSVKEDKIFKRKGRDISMEVPIKFTTAILGGSVEIPNIDGSTIDLKIPKGLQPGDQLKIKDKGFSILGSSSRGDCYVIADVKLPKKLNSKQEEILKEFDGEYKDDDDKGFWGKIFG